MTADEMVSALTYRKGEFRLTEELDNFKGELAKKGFGNLDCVLLLRAVLAALDRDIYAKDWADLMVKSEVRLKLPEGFKAAAKGIRGALKFLEELGVTSDRLLPYGLQLVLLGEFFRLCPVPNPGVVELLKRWFWVTSFTGWFGGVNTAQATHALSEIRELAKGRGTGFRIIDLDAPAQPFPERYDGRSARVRAFLLYLASLHPRSLRGADDLEPGALLSELGPKAVGYVSSSQKPLAEMFSSPANRLFLDREHRGQAFDELAKLGDVMLMELLPTHGFPAESVGHLLNGDREGLIRARLAYLIDGEREFLQARKVSLPTKRTAATVADSDASGDELDPP